MTETEPTGRWRPRLLWIPMGGLVGAGSGALVGGAVMIGAAALGAAMGQGAWDDLLLSIIGVIYGGIVGAGVGVVVGIEMALLVGAHLPRELARHRAHLLGYLLPPLTMLVLAGVLLDLHLSLLAVEELWVLLVPVAAGALGGPLARWIAGLQPLAPVT